MRKMMEMKYRVLILLMVMVAASGMSLRSAQAQSFTSLDSDLFAPGTNISTAFSGVTLATMTLVADPNGPPNPFGTWMPSYAPVYAGANNSFSASASSLPSNVGGWGYFFGPLDGSCFQSCSGPQGDNFGQNLLVNFNAPVSQVDVSQIGNAENGVAIEAFNSSNQEVSYCAATPGIALGPGNYGCYSVLSAAGNDTAWQVSTMVSAPNISRVVIGGYNMGGDQVNTIRYAAAPEIDPSSWVSGLTLLLGGLLVLRGGRSHQSLPKVAK
jgi:hypothetical protein